ncbi:MAG: hypothetical protein WCG25_08050 [bacterium]
MIAPSNIKTRDDIVQIKDYLTLQNAEKMKIIAKIENAQALNHIDQISDISD